MPIGARCLLLLGLLGFGVAAARAESTTARPVVDLVTGPIVGPTRVISLGGAYTALGYGIDNAVITPAAYAARTLWDTSWFEWDATFDDNLNILPQIRIFNGLGSTTSDLSSLTIGASAMAGELGFGGLVRVQEYSIGTSARLSQTLANYGACYALFEGQLLLGAAARTAIVELTDAHNAQNLAHFGGTGPELGVIVAPAELPVRVGVAARSGVQSRQDTGPESVLGLMLPRAIELPGELQVGLAYQLGARPLNRRWTNPLSRRRELQDAIIGRRLRRQREQARLELSASGLQPDAATDLALRLGFYEPRDPAFWQAEHARMAAENEELDALVAQAARNRRAALLALPRQFLLLSADLLVIAATRDGVGVDAFLGMPRDSGRKPSLGVRVGAEAEPIPNFMRLRAGSYLEPSRFETVSPRLHATFGTDVRLFSWNVFGLLDRFELRATAGLDVAARYRNFGFSLGVWH
jgi:hypothetical protein